MSDAVLLVFAIVFWGTAGTAQRSSESATPSALTAAEVSFYARILKMADQRTFNDSLLREGFASSSTPIRWASSLAAAQLTATHREKLLPLLREIAVSRDTALAANAIFGLGLARDSNSVAVIASLVERDIPVGRSAAWALGEIGAPAQQAISGLLDQRARPVITAELLYAAAKIRPLDLRAVTPHLRSRDASIRAAAVYAIARQGVPGGVRAVLLVDRNDAFVRAQMARALRRAAVGDSLQEEAMEVLSSLVRDDYASVRVNTVYSLASYGPVATELLYSTINDRDVNVRIATAQAMGYVLGSSTREWERLWDVDTTFAYRAAILEASVRAGAIIPALDSWRTHSNWRYRAAFIRASGADADTLNARVAALIGTFDPESRVRSAAYEVLVASDPNRLDIVTQRTLDSALNDPDPVAREAIPWYTRTMTEMDSVNRNRPIEWYEKVVREVVVRSLDGPLYGAVLDTDRGTIRLALLGLHAPLTVYNFMTLARQGYYSVTRFHRVVPNFVAQDGDPRGDGNGGPGYSIRDEFNREAYVRGSVGMATAGQDTGGSQYFLTLSPQPHLEGHYTVFARVVSGMAVMDAIVQGDLVKSISVP